MIKTEIVWKMQVSQTLRVNKQVMSLKEDQKEDSFVIFIIFLLLMIEYLQ